MEMQQSNRFLFISYLVAASKLHLYQRCFCRFGLLAAEFHRGPAVNSHLRLCDKVFVTLCGPSRDCCGCGCCGCCVV